MIVSASILAADFSDLGSEIKAAERAGADWIHLDVMDGQFVPNLTFGPPIIKSLRKVSDIYFDAHLMMLNPENLISDFIDAGVNSITLHYEKNPKLEELIDIVKNAGIKIGLSINPKTAIDKIEPYLSRIDMILIMTVEPGFGGQKLILDCLDKVRSLKKKKISEPEKYHYLIQVDGGVNSETINSVKDSGVDVVVAGSYIFKSTDYRNAINNLK